MRARGPRFLQKPKNAASGFCGGQSFCWLAHACGIGTGIAAAEGSPIIDLARSRTTDRAGGQVNRASGGNLQTP